MKLIIGNKKYSSWSLRPWLAMSVKGVEFEEEMSRFDHSTTPYHKHFWEFSPTKMVPVLKVDGRTVWDSLSIMEYVAERNPDRGFWPSDPLARAHARSISCEMHSGFPALRAECPMNMARKVRPIENSPECQADVKRLETIFEECFERYQGKFLFGDFTIADAMMAPVANRIRIYDLTKNQAAIRFCEAIEELPEWQEWRAAGAAEPWICEVAEV